MVGEQVFGALAAGSDLEAAGARPIDQLAGQRRLVAVGTCSIGIAPNVFLGKVGSDLPDPYIDTQR